MEKKASAQQWWDKLGKPQYGGEIVLSSSADITRFDPYYSEHQTQIFTAWLERLISEDWTQDPAEFNYQMIAPHRFIKGLLAESWEFTKPGTLVFHLRKGIHWQNKPPVNEREFVAEDVVFHFNRLYGLGSGYTKPAPYHATIALFYDLASVVALDKYVVAFNWKIQNEEAILEALVTNHSPALAIVAPEAVALWGDVNDWQHAVGTGPFILDDFIPGSSAVLVKNPGYWGRDERHPQNKLPYVDRVRFLIMPDKDKMLEAFLAGKIDILDSVSPEQAQEIQKTNPEIIQIRVPGNAAITLDPRNDVKPFNDVRVRQAMQMAIDLPWIAKNHYGGTVEPYPSAFASASLRIWGKEWAFPYQEWPQDLKGEYAYNPSFAKKLLADAGYPHGFKTNVVTDASADLTLLEIIKTYFAAVGIDMEIRMSGPGVEQDQLAYPGGTIGLDVEPFRQLPRLQTGYHLNKRLQVSDPVFDTFYDRAKTAATLKDTQAVFRETNEYVARQHFAISLLLKPARYTLYQPWLKGFHAQFGSFGWSPPCFSFHAARFWVDGELKKKMGH
jgi:peptide/nickel transport system substrate-binding protein